MILAVQNFKTSNFKTNSANYDVKSNAMSKIDNSKSVADSFTKSNKIAFKGSLAKLGESVLGDAGTKLGGAVRKVGEGLLDKAGAKLTGIVRTGGEELSGAAETKLTGLVGTVGEELSGGAGAEIVDVSNKLSEGTIEVVDAAPKAADEAVGIISEKARKIVNPRELPVTEMPVIAAGNGAANIARERAAIALRSNLSQDKRNAIQEALKDAEAHKYVNIDDYPQSYTDAINDAVNDAGIEFPHGIPFKGLVPDSVGETAKEVGTAVAESAVGETAKSVATEVGTYVAEEVVGEAAMQTFERTIDALAPGAGLAITGARWGLRAYKAGKLGEKVAKSDAVQTIVDKASQVVGKVIDNAIDKAAEASAERYVAEHGDEIEAVMTRAAERRLDAFERRFEEAEDEDTIDFLKRTSFESKLETSFMESISHLSRKKQIKAIKRMYGGTDLFRHMMKKFEF